MLQILQLYELVLSFIYLLPQAPGLEIYMYIFLKCLLWIEQVSSVEIERICNSVNGEILETAAIGVPPPQGGPEQLVIVVVFKDSDSTSPDLNQLKMAFNSALQKRLNPLFRVLLILLLGLSPSHRVDVQS